MKKVIIILDRAHGEGVAGKESLDGKFKEWKASQATIEKLAKGLEKLEIPYALTVEGTTEPGFNERVKRANEAGQGYEVPILISLHHNAHDRIFKARGSEIYVSRSASKESKEVARIIAENLIKDFPEMPWRKEWPDRLEREADFTVLAGNDSHIPAYHGVLVEFGFMSNEEDLKLLKSKAFMNRYAESLLYSITQICAHFGAGNFTPEIRVK